jgi:hypothetical protein
MYVTNDELFHNVSDVNPATTGMQNSNRAGGGGLTIA